MFIDEYNYNPICEMNVRINTRTERNKQKRARRATDAHKRLWLCQQIANSNVAANNHIDSAIKYCHSLSILRSPSVWMQKYGRAKRPTENDLSRMRERDIVLPDHSQQILQDCVNAGLLDKSVLPDMHELYRTALRGMPESQRIFIDASRPKPEGVVTDIQCGSCGKAIGKHPLTGTTCDCIQRKENDKLLEHYANNKACPPELAKSIAEARDKDTHCQLHPAQKALRRIRERANHQSTIQHHGMQYRAGLLTAANMLESLINRKD